MFNTDPFEAKMVAAIAHFQEDLKKIRTGRAHPDMLAGITVEVYGVRTPLNQVATVTAPEPQLLQVTPFDQGNVKVVVEAIRNDQGLGFNPTDDGRIVRVAVPSLTEERRRQIAKSLGDKVEEARIVLRNVRQDALKEAKRMKDAKELSEDDVKRIEKEIDRLVADSQSKLDVIVKDKEREVMTI